MDMSEEYKANRKKPKEEDEIKRYDAFFEVLNKLPDMLDEEVLKFRGVEADDLIANLVMKCEPQLDYDHIWIVSSDRDLYQLISENTSIFNIFGLLPYDVPSFLVIGAWPVAMGVSMWVQQKLNPAPTDPMQAKIFAFFPLFLTVILAPFPSGLVIYWTVNNILTMAQQVFIMRRTTVKTTT